MKKLTGMILIAFMICLLAGAGTAFADKSSACDNASATGKGHANSKSAVGNCDNEPPAPSGGEESGSGDSGDSGDSGSGDTSGGTEPPPQDPPPPPGM